ncbi:DUF6913 domain-containing protein [Flavimarina sp. Hel_I_48]|uniref:DUF6913 domain-containing protein n=1 Tax=Flavimarina sp. Hel_I_48 TaxID=1392488 RepID=UPI00068C6CE1|nr:hypothetical protein [Flavimarina sp. Hel_I_48]
MFLDVWREKRIKRNLKEAALGYPGASPATSIQRVGLLVDTTEDVDIEALTSALSLLQKQARINVIYYVERVHKTGFPSNSTFDNRAINWQGELSNAQTDFFMNQHYDLLISYYVKALPILQFITAKANAHFKVGFPGNGTYLLNDLTIDTKPENISVFCTELKNYLKILKRIE